MQAAAAAARGLSLAGSGNLPQAGWQSKKCSVRHVLALRKIPSINGNYNNPRSWWIDTFNQQIPFCRARLLRRTWTTEPLWIVLRDVAVRTTLFARKHQHYFTKPVATHSHCRKIQWGSYPALPLPLVFVSPNLEDGGCWVLPPLRPPKCSFTWDEPVSQIITIKRDKPTLFHHTVFFFFLLTKYPVYSAPALAANRPLHELNQLTNLAEN